MSNKPGLGASDHPSHRLEIDVSDRIAGPQDEWGIFNTETDGGVLIETDGGRYNDGVLWGSRSMTQVNSMAVLTETLERAPGE